MIVTILYSNLNIGGIPTKIIDIVNRLGKTHPHIPIHILLQKGNPHDLRTLIKNPRATVIDLPVSLSFGRSFLYMLWAWWRLIRTKSSVVLAFISPYALPALAAKQLLFWRRIRVIVSEDHYTENVLKTMRAPWLQRIGIQTLYPHADAVIAPTRTIQQQLSRLFRIPTKRILVIHNWTRLVGKKLAVHKRTWDIVHVGRLVTSKNPMQVLLHMEHYVKKYPKSRCAIVGEGEEQKRLTRYIKTHGLAEHITLHPAALDVSAYLSRAKLFLFIPETKMEGFPIVLLEAMASGAIVVTRFFSGVDEIIDNGHTGIVSRGTISTSLLRKTSTRADIRDSALRFVKTHCSANNIDRYISTLINSYA